MMDKKPPTGDFRIVEAIFSAALPRAIDFVKFAEAKNAALLAFASAWTLSITTTLNSQTLSQSTVTSMAVARALFVLAILITTWSFLPKLRLEGLEHTSEPKNLLFFRHVAELKPSAVKAAVIARYVADGTITAEYLDDLACQVAINSAIATKKFRMFEFAAIAVMLGIVVLAMPALGSGWDSLLKLNSGKH